MSECLHPRITTFAIADEGPEHGKPAGLWACEACGIKFGPLGTGLVELARLSAINAQLVEALNGLLAATDPNGDTPVEGWKSAWRKARAALAAATKEQP